MSFISSGEQICGYSKIIETRNKQFGIRETRAESFGRRIDLMERLYQTYFWPRTNKTVRHHIAICDLCLWAKWTNKKSAWLLQPLQIAEGQWNFYFDAFYCSIIIRSHFFLIFNETVFTIFIPLNFTLVSKNNC